MQDIDIARVCHEANRVIQIHQADPTIPVSEAWDEISLDIRNSAVTGVRNRLRLNLSPAEMHQSWCDQKLAGGWGYGPVKDEALKEHPLLIPYEQLPADQQVKDALFSAIVDACAVAGDVEFTD